MLAERLQKDLCPVGSVQNDNLTSIVALPHTEGCGRSAGVSEDMFIRTILGYAAHPMVACAVLLEHGCEKTHNDKMQGELTAMGEDKSKWGYASIQLDGGIEKAYIKIKAYFETFLQSQPVPRAPAPLTCLRVGIVAAVEVPAAVSKVLGAVAAAVTRVGGTVVTAGSVGGSSFLHSLLADGAEGQNDTLGYGQRASAPGLHRMHSISQNISELLTGIGGTGVEVIIAFVGERCVEGHPMLPVVQVGVDGAAGAGGSDDGIDLPWTPTDSETEQQTQRDQLLSFMVGTINRTVAPKLFGTTFVNFQMSRGTTAVSL
jgi:altronate dehydratase